MPQPIWRAAQAGNAAFRSGVVLNWTLARSSAARLLAVTICSSSRRVAVRIDSRVLSSTQIAPRMPRQVALVHTSLVSAGWQKKRARGWLLRALPSAVFGFRLVYFTSPFGFHPPQSNRPVDGPK